MPESIALAVPVVDEVVSVIPLVEDVDVVSVLMPAPGGVLVDDKETKKFNEFYDFLENVRLIIRHLARQVTLQRRSQLRRNQRRRKTRSVAPSERRLWFHGGGWSFFVGVLARSFIVFYKY